MGQAMGYIMRVALRWSDDKPKSLSSAESHLRSLFGASLLFVFVSHYNRTALSARKAGLFVAPSLGDSFVTPSADAKDEKKITGKFSKLPAWNFTYFFCVY
jgi:hypothetical protein